MKREKTRVAQIAKKRWLKDENQNSKFFHTVINQKINSSLIEKMRLDDGMTLSSLKEIHEGAVCHF